MDQTDFAIVMVSGILIIIAIFLIILLKIFEKNKKIRQVVTLLPEITKIETYEAQPGKFMIRPLEIEELEKEFRSARDLQKKGSVIEMMEEKEDMSSGMPEKTIHRLNKTAQIPKGIKENPKEIKKETIKGSTGPIKEIFLSQPVLQSSEDNEKLKLEDLLIEIPNENTQMKAKRKRSSSKNLEKADKLIEKEIPEKKPMKRPIRKKNGKDRVPEQVSKKSDEKSPSKKIGIKVSKKEKKQAIVKENPGSGEL